MARLLRECIRGILTESLTKPEIEDAIADASFNSAQSSQHRWSPRQPIIDYVFDERNDAWKYTATIPDGSDNADKWPSFSSDPEEDLETFLSRVEEPIQLNLLEQADIREYIRDLLTEMSLPGMQWVDTSLATLEPEILDRIWSMYTNTYLSMGMDLSASSAAGLTKYQGVFLIDVDDPPDGVPDAFIIYKPTAFGNKIALLGTCQEERCLGKRAAKSAVVRKMFDLLSGGGFFIEAGEKIEQMLRSSAVPPVCDEEKIKEFLGKKFVQFLDDCYYERRLAMASAIVTKRIYGSFG